MEILCATADNKINLSDRYVYFDNDILSFLYQHDQVIDKVHDIFSDCILFVDQLTKFEFLRGIYVPKEKKLMEEFITSFEEPTDHNDIFIKMKENAINLSLIYSQKGRTKGVSAIDLLLAGRLIYLKKFKPLLVTGNRKDFPPFIFDSKAAINIENESTGDVQVFSIIEFSQSKFDQCTKDLEKIN